MRPSPSPRLLSALIASLLLGACGGGNAPTLPDGGPIPDGGVLCTLSTQCPAGEGCIGNVCTALPCGGCDTDSVCDSATNACVPAQGATCPTVGSCPQGYVCNSNNVCSTECTVDSQCAAGLVCNSNSGTCAQCIFDSNCTTVPGKPRCDATSGNCVACLSPIDCTMPLGPGHFCDTATHSCKTGCASDGDCNLSAGEHCSGATATAPGVCIQCTTATEATDCAAAAPACDATGHCVVCTADKYCGPATPRCDVSSQTCVECLPANNSSGADCGYAFTQGGTKDPHNETICDAAGNTCVPGCTSDANCGCPIDPSTGKPTSCQRLYVQEHCDLTKMTSADDPSGTTEGACVECTSNSQCYCHVSGNQNGTDPSTGLSCANYQHSGSYQGARCVSDACVSGCDTDADCPSNKLCSLSGSTAHQCVECSCLNRTVNDKTGTDSGWCDDPTSAGQLGGCGPVSAGSSVYKVCDATSSVCRLKRLDEQCGASTECGDTSVNNVNGQCIPGAQFCVRSKHDYAVGSPETYCSSDHVNGRCGISCDDPQSDQCVSGANCPSGSFCDQATAVDTPPGGILSSGSYCTSTQCTH